MIDEPPSDAGLVHDRVTWLLPTFGISRVGAPGQDTDITALTVGPEHWSLGAEGRTRADAAEAMPPATIVDPPAMVTARKFRERRSHRRGGAAGYKPGTRLIDVPAIANVASPGGKATRGCTQSATIGRELGTHG
jgi:hypothetical protein